MKYNWNDEELSEAFIEFGKEKGVTLYPETTMALAKEVRDKVGSGLELHPSIKETIAELFPKEENDTLSHPSTQLNDIKTSIKSLLTRLAAGKGPIRPEEIEAWKTIIQQKIYVPFQKVSKDLANELRRTMDHIAEKSKEKNAIMEFRNQVQELLFRAIGAGGGKVKVTIELEGVAKYYPNWEKKEVLAYKVVSACRGEMKKIGMKLAKLTGDINATHIYAIGITGVNDYIKQDVESPDKFTTASGFQNYLEDMGYTIDYVDEALKGIEDDNRNRARRKGEGHNEEGKLIPAGERGSYSNWLLESEFADLDTERDKNPIWQQRAISNNARKFAQVPVLKNTGNWTLTMNQFMSSLTYEVMEKMMKKAIEGGADPTVEKAKLENALKEVSVMIDAINARENTWQKGMAIYRLLDPALQQTRDMVTALLRGQSSEVENSDRKIAKGHEVSTIQPVRLTEEDLKNRKKLDTIVRQYSESYATDERRWGEGQNIDAHWNTLLRLSSLQKRGEVNPYFRSAGQMFMDEAIKNNPSLKGNKDLEVAARQVDIETLKEKVKDVANVIFNPSTPDWVLMKIASVGFKMQDLTGEDKSGLSDLALKELSDFEKQYRYLRKAVYQVLKDRGWEAKRIRTAGGKSKVVKESRGDEELKAEIKRKNPNITDEELLKEVKEQSTSRKEYSVVFQRANKQPEVTAKYQYKVIYKKAGPEVDSKRAEVEALNKQISELTARKAPLEKALQDAEKREAQVAQSQQANQASDALKSATNPISTPASPMA